jgi:hypothetical protein
MFDTSRLKSVQNTIRALEFLFKYGNGFMLVGTWACRKVNTLKARMLVYM